MDKVLAVCLNPTFQRTMVFDNFLVGEVNRSANYRLDASGKGVNVARVVSQLGGRAIHLTHLGSNRINEFIELLEGDGIELYWSDSQSTIRTCTTIYNLADRITTELVEEPEAVHPSTEKLIVEQFHKALAESATMVISGTRSPGYSPSLYSDFVKIAKEAGKRVILDIKGEDLTDSLPYGVDFIKPNLSEFAATFMEGLTVLEQEDSQEIKDKVVAKMDELYRRYGCSIMLTRGAFDVWLYAEGTFHELPVEQVKPLNTIGCGDATTAGIAYGLTKGENLMESVKIGLAAGAANAQTLRPGSII